MPVRQFMGAARGASAVTGIAQDNIIFAMILFAFVVWITTKGELATYAAFFKPGAGALGPTPDTVTASSTSGTSTPVQGACPGTTNAPGSGIIGQILNPSTDPVAGPISTVIKTLPTIPGFGVGLGN
jgi:hypothetical protein